MRQVIRRFDKAGMNMSGLRASVFAILFLSLCGMFYVKWVIPLYNKYGDIITEEYAVYVNDADFQIVLEVFAKKNIECIYAKGSRRGYAFINGSWAETLFNYLDDETPGSTKPKDKDFQAFGLWSWERQMIRENATHVKATVRHICNPETTVVGLEDGSFREIIRGDLRLTTTGPFDIQQLRKEWMDKKNEIDASE